MIYFDTAYVAKCYLTDRGHTEVRALASAEDGIAICEFGRLELAAALHRHWREGHLTQAAYAIILKQVAADERQGCWVWLPVTPSLLRTAAARFEQLSRKTFLRAGDALHLACAVEHGFREIYSSDTRVLDAAPAYGLVGKNVIAP